MKNNAHLLKVQKYEYINIGLTRGKIQRKKGPLQFASDSFLQKTVFAGMTIAWKNVCWAAF